MNVVVIGSGFGGLSAAVRLQAKGLNVTILEKRSKPGGRAYVYEQDGFVFDGGPTIITAPAMLQELFEVAGRSMHDVVELMKLDPYYNVRFQDGSVFRYNGNAEDVVSEIRKFNPDDVRGYARFLRRTEAVFDAGFALIDKPFTHLSDMIGVLPQLVRLRANESVATIVNKCFKDERLRQVFSFHPLLIGGNPFQTTSIYALIHKLEQEWGVWFAKGGTGAIVNGLVDAFKDMGGVVRYGAEVSSIDVRERQGKPAVSSVTIRPGETVDADVVVCNADVSRAYMTLVSARHRKYNSDSRISKLTQSMSLFVLYFGTDRKYDNMAHHEILMGPRYKGLVEDVFKNKVLADDFSLYLHRPTATDPSLAPDGCDAWYVLSPVPHLESGTDWENYAQVYGDKILAYLEDRYMPGLRKHIVTRRHIDPLHFSSELNSHLGSAFGVEPTLFQSAWWRPHNKSEDVNGLYFVGAGTHPGAGLPGVVSSGKIAARMVMEDALR